MAVVMQGGTCPLCTGSMRTTSYPVSWKTGLPTQENSPEDTYCVICGSFLKDSIEAKLRKLKLW